MQLSSAAGKCPAPGQAIYSASKHALNGYFHTLRSEVLFLQVNCLVRSNTCDLRFSFFSLIISMQHVIESKVAPVFVSAWMCAFCSSLLFPSNIWASTFLNWFTTWVMLLEYLDLYLTMSHLSSLPPQVVWISFMPCLFYGFFLGSSVTSLFICTSYDFSWL